MTLSVLIIGGYGTFGGRLAELLVRAGDIELIIAGRSRARAAAFCAALGSPQARPLVFDREGDLEAQLRACAPDLVVDASGPFQFYGRDPYRLVRAAIALGIDYLDLADGTDFVAGIAQFDPDARAGGVFVLAGVSSFPVLTAAAVRHLARDMRKVRSITAGIAPSPYARVGGNVIRAVASYAGQKVPLLCAGQAAFGTGLVDTRRHTIGPPGCVPLQPILFSLVAVPDLAALPPLWPGLEEIWIGAGPVPEVLHRLLRLFARAVRAGIVRSLAPMAPLMHWAMNHLVWGEHRGGMFIAVAGTDAHGAPLARSFELLAEGGDGPFIPSMAAAAVIARLRAGNRPAAGARAAVAELELADYDRQFAGRAIATGVWQTQPPPPQAPLYRRLLGEAWSALPAPIRVMHDLSTERQARGRAEVERGAGLLARMVARLFGFPPARADGPVEVSFRVRDGHETWTRRFDARAFTSRQWAGTGRYERLLCERFGPFVFGLALVVQQDKLHLVQRRWSLLGVPLPRALAPRGSAYEHAADGRFNFHVEIGLPLIGLIVRYRGWLEPVPGTCGISPLPERASAMRLEPVSQRDAESLSR